MPRRPRRLVAATARRTLTGTALAALLALTGCGGSAGQVDPTGVDGLRIPTPSPDPADFAEAVDNPWLPLRAGARWRYVVTGTSPARSAEVEVLRGSARVAGVRVTLVRTRVLDGRGRQLRARLASYAQDTRGNVWLLGATETVWGGGGPMRTSWTAGPAARAGLAMAADPRLGDGYLMADAPGRERVRARVDAVDAEQVTDAGTFENLLLIAVSGDVGREGRTSHEWFQRDAGLVVADRLTAAGSEHWVLVDHAPGG